MPVIAVLPAGSDIFAALRSFLLAVLPAGTEVAQAQGNRVPEPAGSDFVLMAPLRRNRISTNIDAYIDSAFTGSVAGSVLTVTAIAFGSLGTGDPVFGTGVSANTSILSQLSGSVGGTGTYSITPSQAAALQQMAGGVAELQQSTEVVVQLDVHGPNSGNNAQVISTTFRDPFGVDLFASFGTAAVPLYADDPKQIPFVNDQNQYENRWVIEARMQSNEIVTVAQQFAAALEVGLIDVDVVYPPVPPALGPSLDFHLATNSQYLGIF